MKRARKRTLIERLKQEHTEIVCLNQQLIQRLQFCLTTLKVISDEDSWAVKEIELPLKYGPDGHVVPQDPQTEIIWVGEDHPNTIAQKALKMLRRGIDEKVEKGTVEAGPTTDTGRVVERGESDVRADRPDEDSKGVEGQGVVGDGGSGGSKEADDHV